MTVLVTGGGGFLGKVIVQRLLQRGEAIRVFGRQARPDLEQMGVEVVCGDLGDRPSVERAVAGVQAVIHTAAKAGVWGRRAHYRRTNITGTENIIQACLKHGVGQLVYTSTPSVVFTGAAFSGEDERLPYGRNWLCHYAETKAVAEQLVLSANGERGLVCTALRPHLIWGEGDPHLIPRVLAKARSGRLRRVGSGRNKVDLTHVDNAADAHLLALDALRDGRGAGKAYFITNDEPVVLWDWIDDLLVKHGLSKVRKQISLPAAYRAGAILEGMYRYLMLPGEPAMTRFVAIELAKDHYFSIEAAKRDLGYRPAVSMEEGMRRLCS